MDPEDLIIKVLNSLDDQYKEISHAIQARKSPISFDELHDKLLSMEAQLTARAPAISAASDSAPAAAFVAEQQSRRTRSGGRGRGRSSRGSFPGRGGYSSNGQSRGYNGKCQLCSEFGHSARRCPSYPLFGANQPSYGRPPPRPAYAPPPSPAAHTAHHSPTVPSTSDWILDSGASHHITTDLANMSLHSPYTGLDDVVIGNGEGLKITHAGHLYSSSSLLLPGALCVPHMRKNLISVAQLCRHNDVNVIFSATDFQVKDRRTGATLVRGPHRANVYYWPAASPPPSALTARKLPASLWHSRFGHPSASILRQLVSSSSIVSGSVSDFACVSCKLHKCHKLPFSESSLSSTAPLELIFSDVWTSPIISNDGFNYYVVFVDHFTKYVWLFPLRRKSDVLQTFTTFKSIVEKYFSAKIITVYTDNGGEFLALRSFFAANGISHLTSPPHTPQHNGYAEHRHRHIVETGLTLLHYASVPLAYWTYAFATAVYLINHLPKANLSMLSSFESLFHRRPNLAKLRVFGCQCFPWLRPYTSHKMEPRSRVCVFFGYSTTQSTYLCFDPSTSKLFVSRHVTFHEDIFPFSTLSNPQSPSVPIPVSLDVLPLPPPVPAVVTPRDPSPDAPPALLPAPSASPPAPPAASAATPPVLPPPSSSRGGHHMQTRSKNNIHKPNKRFGMSVVTSPAVTEPQTLSSAMSDERWHTAMSLEFDALLRNGTWDLVPPDPSQNVVGCKWVYRIKRKPDGTVDKFKARLVAKGFHQRPGVDFQETFSPVVKPATVRLVLSLAVSKGWPLRQMDVNNAFLHGRLTEDVYMAQPPGFVDKAYPSYVCKLQKAIYGLKQAPRAWYSELRQFLLAMGFVNTTSDTSLFVFRHSGITAYLLVYVDDLILTGSDSAFLNRVVESLGAKFSLKDMGDLGYFLGVEVLRSAKGCFLSQRKYVVDLLTRHNMLESKPVQTPTEASIRLLLADGSAPADASAYRQALGGLQYLSFTRPDISFAVNKLSQFMQAPTVTHWGAESASSGI